uniref:Uncharacterized protein n=1 Tax=Seriola lalandi dorsalis TaxID=1841481 RepID=A0A3B4YCW1_SERLL
MFKFPDLQDVITAKVNQQACTLHRTDIYFAYVNYAMCQITTHPGLELLHLLLASLHGDLFSFIQTVLQVFNGLLHVLLHALQVSAGVLLFLQLLCHHGSISNGLLGFFLCISRALKSVHNSLLVSLCLLHLFIFLSQLTLNVSLDLVELKLGSENLPFLMLQ